MTRRIPPAFGLVIVIAGVHALYTLLPILTMTLRTIDLPWWIAVMLGGTLAQLASGIAIAVGSRHARPIVLAWTALSVATFLFARESLELGSTPSATIVVFVELVAGPAITWLVPLWVGDAPVAPMIPRAHVVSSSPPPDTHASNVESRRFDLGVVMFGLGIIWIVSTTLSHAIMFAALARDPSAGGFIGELVFFAHSVAVALLAISAGRRLLDVTIDTRVAVRRVALFAILDVAGDFARLALTVGYQLYERSTADAINSEIMSSMLLQWSIGFALGLIIPLFLWWYARSTRSVDAVLVPSPSRRAAAPAWAMIWLAPVLLTRMFVVGIVDNGELSSGVLRIVGIACAVQGVLYLVAAIATFRAQRLSDRISASLDSPDEAPSLEQLARTQRVARIAAMSALIIATLLVATWLVVTFGLDEVDRFRFQAPIGPLVNLLGCAATMWWMLRRR